MSGDDKSNTLICVVGARPNFMKIAPIMAVLKRDYPQLRPYLVHTGQHYDEAMKATFFDQLGIPEPDIDLEVGGGSHAQQTAEIMKRFEPVMLKEKPFAVLVVGDVTSTIACALVAVKEHVPVIHVEAGLRSGDRAMPEEINRVLTDQISDRLFTTERAALENLTREGIDADKVAFTGNVMIDTLRANLDQAMPIAQLLADHPKRDVVLNAEKGFALLTMHRPSNVDDEATLTRLLDVLLEISADMPLVFPVHPRTRGRLEAFGLSDKLAAADIALLEPVGYLEMLGILSSAKLVLTDSGGLQEESTALGVACITLRESTERPITVHEGTNTIVGTDSDRIRRVFRETLNGGGKGGRIPEYWDGKAAERIVAAIDAWRLTL